MIGAIVILFLLVFLVVRFLLRSSSKQWKKPKKSFNPKWRPILLQKVLFYGALGEEDRRRFEYKILEFLENVSIEGVNTDVDDIDRILVASSAVIPIFSFPNWHYTNLYKVLIYPSAFNSEFEQKGMGRHVLGLVGNGPMEGKMILSKKALHLGFENESDKQNTAIHEFVHLIDKMDGEVDGVPKVLLEKQYTIPWLSLIDQKIKQVYHAKTDINPYGGTNNAEFFAVASEYFFERPKLLKRKHPDLYHALEEIFDVQMNKVKLERVDFKQDRNDLCACGSGKKYKHCCGAH